MSNCGGDSTGPVDIDAFLIPPEALGLDIAEPGQVIARSRTVGGSPSDHRVSWTSSDDMVISVNQKGRVTGVSEGWAAVYATFNDVLGEATVPGIQPGAHDCSAQSAIGEADCLALEALHEATNEPGCGFGSHRGGPDGWAPARRNWSDALRVGTARKRWTPTVRWAGHHVPDLDGDGLICGMSFPP